MNQVLTALEASVLVLTALVIGVGGVIIAAVRKWAELKKELAQINTTAGKVEAEVTHNHGSSMKDAVGRLEKGVGEMKTQLHIMSRDIGGLREEIREDRKRTNTIEKRLTDVETTLP